MWTFRWFGNLFRWFDGFFLLKILLFLILFLIILYFNQYVNGIGPFALSEGNIIDAITIFTNGFSASNTHNANNHHSSRFYWQFLWFLWRKKKSIQLHIELQFSGFMWKCHFNRNWNVHIRFVWNAYGQWTFVLTRIWIFIWFDR